jgi:hypothetical protein
MWSSFIALPREEDGADADVLTSLLMALSSMAV